MFNQAASAAVYAPQINASSRSQNALGSFNQILISSMKNPSSILNSVLTNSNVSQKSKVGYAILDTSFMGCYALSIHIPPIHLYTCLYIYIPPYASIYPPMRLYTPLCIYIPPYASIYPPMRLHTPLCIYIPPYASTYPLMHLYTPLSIHGPPYASIYPPPHLYTPYASIYPPYASIYLPMHLYTPNVE